MKVQKLVNLLGLVLIIAAVAVLPVHAEEITIVGTGSGEIIVQAIGAAFSKENPGTTISTPLSIGSGGGIKAVGNDQAVLGRIAREIQEKEKPYALTYVPFVKLPIVFFVNSNVTVQDLSPQQLCDIYSGKVTNWKEVGGQDAEIRVIRREDGDSSLDVLQKSFPGFKDITITAKSKTTLSDPETCKAVQDKENTIAFGTYANAKTVSVKVLKVGGKNPADADYPYTGTLALVFKEKNKAGNIGKFIDFVKSPASHGPIRETGGLPM